MPAAIIPTPMTIIWKAAKTPAKLRAATTEGRTCAGEVLPTPTTFERDVELSGDALPASVR